MTGHVREGWSAEMDRRLAEMRTDPDGYLRRIRRRGFWRDVWTDLKGKR